jgi:hypothetical protein
MESTELCEIMGRYGSDKGHSDISKSWHNYTLIYYKLFKELKDKRVRIFEMGLGTNNPSVPSNMCWLNGGSPGASLRGWTEFFPNGVAYGADIDKGCLFQTDRIKTYYCDQTNSEEIKKMWNERELWEPFDIIIDDGLHEAFANICFFENSIFKLKRGGYFIIEDLLEETVISLMGKLDEWKIKYPEIKFDLVKVPSYVNNIDNNLLIAHYK